MKENKVYEYLVTKDWFGSLEKGSRLYYDYSKGGYIFHTEYESKSKSNRYESSEFNSADYFISAEIANRYVEIGDLLTGPELGVLELVK